MFPFIQCQCFDKRRGVYLVEKVGVFIKIRVLFWPEISALGVFLKDLFWFTVQITQFQKSLITGFLMIEMDSHTHCEYTECIFGMKMLFMVGGWAFSRMGG